MSLLDDTYAGFVNLDHRRDRLEHMQRELARVGLKAERVRGRHPNEWDGDPRQVAVMWNRTPGAIGCYMSQCTVMENALWAGKHALVMEDDLVFCDDFHERLEIIEQFLSDRLWDIFWLGGTYHVNPPVWHKDDLGCDIKLTEHPRIVRAFGAFSTHAYLVNVNSIGRVLDLLDGLLSRSIGIDWSMIQLQPELQTFAFAPGCVKQYDNQSDIGNGMTIFSGFAKLGAYWWQPRMEDFDPLTFNWAEAR